jgi:hypothetical protein
VAKQDLFSERLRNLTSLASSRIQRDREWT